MKIYLTRRMQKVALPSISSDWINVYYDAPQNTIRSTKVYDQMWIRHRRRSTYRSFYLYYVPRSVPIETYRTEP